MSWADKIQVKKGDRGEEIVKTYLEKKGFIVYNPATSGAHAFDILAVKDKVKFVIAEIKTKPKMLKYNSTGFDIRNYNEYVTVQDKTGINVFIFFISGTMIN